jgi:hypothetical protein
MKKNHPKMMLGSCLGFQYLANEEVGVWKAKLD